MVEWAFWIQIYLLLSIALFLITGFLFARQNIISKNPELRLKGRFLIFASTFFIAGTIIDVIGANNSSDLTIFLARFFVIISSICFYIGYTLPRFIKDMFIKV